MGYALPRQEVRAVQPQCDLVKVIALTYCDACTRIVPPADVDPAGKEKNTGHTLRNKDFCEKTGTKCDDCGKTYAILPTSCATHRTSRVADYAAVIIKCRKCGKTAETRPAVLEAHKPCDGTDIYKTDERSGTGLHVKTAPVSPS